MSAWTLERTEAVWRDLTARGGERPIVILRRRFRHGLDAEALPPPVARALAQLFLGWGVLQASEAWVMAEPERGRWLREAFVIFGDAESLAEEAELRSMASFNRGLIELLLALVPDPAFSILVTLGTVASSTPLPHTPAVGERLLELRGAFEHLAASQRAVAAPLQRIAAGLLGLAAAELPIRERLRWLDRVDGDDDFAERAKRERARLRAAGFLTRSFGRLERAPGLEAMAPIELSLRAFVLPERTAELLDRLAQIA